ncbi:MAG: hypothetical protein WBN50_09850 [Lutimonas sp.]
MKNIATLLPTVGILIFIGLYIYAANLYPGGSQLDSNSLGFDWMNNYWCNLMNENGMNGLENPARPFAILALIILCSSLALFFLQFAKYFMEKGIWKSIIQILGTLSMISSVLIFSKYHDIMTTISSILGVLVVVGIIRTIYKSNLTVFKISGIVCIILLGINNLIYYSGNYIEYLPLIQKITFGMVLIWIVGLNLKMNNKNMLQHGV